MRSVLRMNERTMPGDIGLGTVGTDQQGKSVWERMAHLINRRRLDLRILMDAHDRRNRGTVDVSTFRRSLCYAFGDQWFSLAMTTKEFEMICAPYILKAPNAEGQAEGIILWQKFAVDVQNLANNNAPSSDFLARLEQVERKERLKASVWNRYGVTELELKTMCNEIRSRLLTYSKTIGAAFQRIDMDNSGTLSRDEIERYFQDACIPSVNDRTLTALLDFVDADGDGQFNYGELADVIMLEDIIEAIPVEKVVSRAVIEKRTPLGHRGATVAEVRAACKTIKERIMTKHTSIRQALFDIDADGGGTLSRREICQFLSNWHLLEFVDSASGATRAGLRMHVVDTLLDFVDADGDGVIEYAEFARILTLDDILEIIPPHLLPEELGGTGGKSAYASAEIDFGARVSLSEVSSGASGKNFFARSKGAHPTSAMPPPPDVAVPRQSVVSFAPTSAPAEASPYAQQPKPHVAPVRSPDGGRMRYSPFC